MAMKSVVVNVSPPYGSGPLTKFRATEKVSVARAGAPVSMETDWVPTRLPPAGADPSLTKADAPAKVHVSVAMDGPIGVMGFDPTGKRYGVGSPIPEYRKCCPYFMGAFRPSE